MIKTKNINVLIIGASGLIGSHLFNYLKKKKIKTFGTFFKKKKLNLYKFNIFKDKLDSLKNINYISHIIFTSGLNKRLDDVEKNFKKENNFNYKKIKLLMNECDKRRIKVIYISSDAVFDGKKGNYSESSTRNPINKYGLIKYKVEKYIQYKLKMYLIVRISKILSFNKKDNSIIRQTLNSIKAKNLKFASDEIFSPIFIEDFCESIHKLISKDLNGIFHLNSIKKISRYHLAKKLINYLNIKVKLKKCSLNSFKLKARRGLRLNLNTKKYDNIFKTNKKTLKQYLKY